MSRPSIRRSQIITTFGPGSIVNLVNGSFVGMGIDYWPRDTKFEDRVYDDRLQRRLGKNFFVQPPSKEVNEAGLPYRRFPRWFFCPHPECRMLQPFEEWERRSPRDNYFKPLVCPDHRIPLVPMNFLVACLHGHIDDFPWSEWVHRNGTTCSNMTELQYVKGYSGAGLGGVVIKCPKCNAARNMRGSFSTEAFGDMRCDGSRPWTGKPPVGSCSQRLVTVQRGGSNVYFPRIISSIAIPSAFNNMIEEIKRTEGWMALSSVTSLDSTLVSPELKDGIIKQIVKETGRTIQEIRQFVERHGSGQEEQKEETTDEDYLYDEYSAFHGNYEPSAKMSRDFRVEDATADYAYSDLGIRSVFMVKAIREVRALAGFTRLRPLDGNDEPESGVAAERPHLVALSERNLNWLPAMEVRGEGIFLTFDESRLEAWAGRKEVEERLDLMNVHYRRSCESHGQPFVPLSAKRVFLHTLAHLLIKQLSFECGYASASLRERIYCDRGGVEKMQGILIYTAAGDADGTLGGLVRQAKSDKFPQTLAAALKNSSWCSNDPLCVESHGQGFESSNMAACYACCLLPETSCENFNKFLDRALVVGLLDKPSLGFFEKTMELLV
jgi:hypothetical protein